METKDLILLMLIPIMLISLIVYTDKNPTITGAVTAKPEESNIIGTYSVMPSFKAKINYDLKDYDEIKDSLDRIIQCKKNSNNIQSCTAEANNNEDNFEWALNCDKGAEKVLYDFAEFLQDCIDSGDNNCLCSKKLELQKEDVQKYGLVPNSEYEIILTQIPSDYKQIRLESKKISSLSQTINSNGLKGWMPKRFSLAYSSTGFPTINLFFFGDISEKENQQEDFEKEKILSLGPLKEVLLYKNDNNKQKIKSMDFVKQEGESLLYPNNKAIVDSSNKPVNTKELPKCNIKQKNIHKFCVTKKDSKIMVYDAIDGQVKERAVTIKFAAYIP